MPTIAPTKALTRTSSANCRQFACNPRTSPWWAARSTCVAIAAPRHRLPPPTDGPVGRAVPSARVLPCRWGEPAPAVGGADLPVALRLRRQVPEHELDKLRPAARLQRLVPAPLEANGRAGLATHGAPAGGAGEVRRVDLQIVGEA